MVKRLVLRLVAAVILIAGIKVAFFPGSKAKPVDLNPEQTYSQKMAALSARFEALEKEGNEANLKAAGQPAKTPGSANELLTSLVRIHNEKDQYVRDLQALDVPKKFEDAHKTFVEWRIKEQETETELLKGYSAVSEGKKKVVEQIDALVASSEKASKEYEQKLSAIAKKNGFDSIQGFFEQKIKR